MSKYSASGRAWQAQRRRVLDRDSWTCAYCGKGLQGTDATVDHLIPVASDPGRTYGDDELVSCCRTCNSRKQDKATFRVDYVNPRWL